MNTLNGLSLHALPIHVMLVLMPLPALVLILTIFPSRTCALTTQRPPQLWPHVLVTTFSPARRRRGGLRR